MEQDLLDLEVENPVGSGSITIREYFRLLLSTLWKKEKKFNGGAPFIDFGWREDIYVALVKADIVDGDVDEEGDVGWFDKIRAEAIVLEMIDDCFNKEEI